ncbi:MAG: hypothetical protein ACJAS9_000695 [Polaribacter sp.]
MHIFIKIISSVALIVSLGWLYFEPNFEPLLTSVVSLSALVSSFMLGKKVKDDNEKQDQNVSDNSSGIQAGGNVTINNSSKDA